MPDPIVAVLAEKINEEASLTIDMLNMLPPGKESWRPDWPATTGAPPFTSTQLAFHLVESFSGVCACFLKLHPTQLSHFVAFKDKLAQIKEPSISDSILALTNCQSLAAEGFAATRDNQLATLIPTHFSPNGEPFLDTLMSNWKHINHHAHQLFLYLKLLGLPVSTQHLYKFK